MSDKPDGGAAFPRPIGHNGLSHAEEHEASHEQQGMSLRDYFAAQVICMAAHDLAEPEAVAARSYAIADAMIAERAK